MRKDGITMKRFIDEFFYGNIEPQARSKKQSPAVKKEMEILTKNEDLLTKALTGENQKLFLEYVNAWGVVSGFFYTLLHSRPFAVDG